MRYAMNGSLKEYRNKGVRKQSESKIDQQLLTQMGQSIKTRCDRTYFSLNQLS